MGFVVQVGKGGRLVIPAEIRKHLGLEPGDSVLINQVCGGISMIPLREAVRRAQEEVRRYVPEGVSLVDDLIRDRRDEAARG
jgi:AbrB family looped-hinge helix DNA binding protein